jgi:hypothetical protein
MFWLVIQAGNATFGWRFFVYDCHQAEIGQKRSVIASSDPSFEWPLHFETCRAAFAYNSSSATLQVLACPATEKG